MKNKICKLCLFGMDGKCEINHVPLTASVLPYFETLLNTEYVFTFPSKDGAKRRMSGRVDISKITVNGEEQICCHSLPTVESLIHAIAWTDEQIKKHNGVTK